MLCLLINNLGYLMEKAVCYFIVVTVVAIVAVDAII